MRLAGHSLLMTDLYKMSECNVLKSNYWSILFTVSLVGVEIFSPSAFTTRDPNSYTPQQTIAFALVQALLSVLLHMCTAILRFATMLCASPATCSAIMKNTSNLKALAASMKRFFTLILFTTITFIFVVNVLIFYIIWILIWGGIVKIYALQSNVTFILIDF